MKNKYFWMIIISVVMLSFGACSSKQSIPDQKLDALEKIITNYEPEFQKTAYNTPEYTQLVAKWNNDIGEWAKDFENERYEKDSNGAMIIEGEGDKSRYKQNKEYAAVETRWISLNNRMSKMILKGIPEEKSSEPVANENEKASEGQ